MTGELSNLDDLLEGWRLWRIDTNDKGKLTQAGAWRRDNPGEWDKLRLYYEGKGPRPDLASIPGKQMVEHVDALIEARGTVEPPPTGGIDPPQGPFITYTTSVFRTEVGSGVIEKVHVTTDGGSGFGVGDMKWPPQKSTGRFVIRDVKAENIKQKPGAYPGTTGAALWLGQTIDAYRIWCSNAEWMACFMGSRCVSTKLHDFSFVNMPFVGIYPEHCTHDSEVFDGEIYSRGNCINMEWWYGPNNGVIPEHAQYAASVLGNSITQGRAGSWGNKFYNLKLRSSGGYCGYFDAGSFGNEIAVDGYMDVDGPYGFILPKRLMDPNRPNIIKPENINWNSIPSDRRIIYHDNPIGA